LLARVKGRVASSAGVWPRLRPQFVPIIGTGLPMPALPQLLSLPSVPEAVRACVLAPGGCSAHDRPGVAHRVRSGGSSLPPKRSLRVYGRILRRGFPLPPRIAKSRTWGVALPPALERFFVATSMVVGPFMVDRRNSRPIQVGCDNILVYEYFHGDNGAGLGRATGWTGLVGQADPVLRPNGSKAAT
jgi:hypothetical protein